MENPSMDLICVTFKWKVMNHELCIQNCLLVLFAFHKNGEHGCTNLHHILVSGYTLLDLTVCTLLLLFFPCKINRSLSHLISHSLKTKCIISEYHLPSFQSFYALFQCYADLQGSSFTMLEVQIKSRPISGRLPKVVFCACPLINYSLCSTGSCQFFFECHQGGLLPT